MPQLLFITAEMFKLQPFSNPNRGQDNVQQPHNCAVFTLTTSDTNKSRAVICIFLYGSDL